MFQEDDKLLLVLVGVMILVAFSMVLLFIVFNNRKNKLLQEQILEKKKFENELAETQIEIREATLRNISWELHDNIGQLMTLAKIHLQNSKSDPDKIEETVQILGNALQEVRALSKSINPESLKNMSLLEAIHNEMNRFERMKFIQTEYKIQGNPFEIPNKVEIIIFRILQEFFSNTIKHSRGTSLSVLVQFSENKLIIHSKDNGIGFDENNDFTGIGLKNMKTRAKLIDAQLTLNSSASEGTELIIQKSFL